MVIVFRGTETRKEWIENFTVTMEQLSGESKALWSLPFWGHQVRNMRYINHQQIALQCHLDRLNSCCRLYSVDSAVWGCVGL